MKESEFVGIFETIAKKVVGEKITVSRKANLFYELYLNRELKLMLSRTDEVEMMKPKRGTSAYQTDICILEEINGVKLPRLAIEFKEIITTHDVLTYSAKAGQHKRIYPWLRYGMLASNECFVPNRFFIHNEHLDFCVAAKNYKQGETLEQFTKDLVEGELEVSRKLEKINFDNLKFDYYRRGVEFTNFGKENS